MGNTDIFCWNKFMLTILTPYLLIICQIHLMAQPQFTMYKTDHPQNGYCLLFYVPNDIEDYEIYEQLYILGATSKKKPGEYF